MFPLILPQIFFSSWLPSCFEPKPTVWLLPPSSLLPLLFPPPAHDSYLSRANSRSRSLSTSCASIDRAAGGPFSALAMLPSAMATEGPLEMAAVAAAPTTMTNSSRHFSSSQVPFLTCSLLVFWGSFFTFLLFGAPCEWDPVAFYCGFD